MLSSVSLFVTQVRSSKSTAALDRDTLHHTLWLETHSCDGWFSWTAYTCTVKPGQTNTEQCVCVKNSVRSVKELFQDSVSVRCSVKTAVISAVSVCFRRRNAYVFITFFMINSNKVTSSNKSAIKARCQHTQMSSTHRTLGEQVLMLALVLDNLMNQGL